MASSKSCCFPIFLYSLVLLSMGATTSAQSLEVAAPLVRPPLSLPPGRRTVTCTLRQFPSCFQVRARCPVGCPTSCFMDCTLCKPVCNCDRPGAVCQDPRFIGGDGITFYFHGQRDRDFCLVTDRHLHINAHFIGKRVGANNRDFTWVQSLGVLFPGHRLFVGARKTAAWDDAIDRLELAFDGEPIKLPPAEGAEWHSQTAPHISLTRTRDANGVAVGVVAQFAINAVVVPITEEDSKRHGYNITDEDCFAHLDLVFTFYNLTDDVHGILGQTYRKNNPSRARMDVAVPVLGGEKEFATSGIFSTDCLAARFQAGGAAAVEKMGKEHENMGTPRTTMQCHSRRASGCGMACTR